MIDDLYCNFVTDTMYNKINGSQERMHEAHHTLISI